MSNEQEVERFETPLQDLRPLDTLAHRAERPELQRLSDDELLLAARQPADSHFIVVNMRTGMLHDGNGRVTELQRRADDPGSTITWATTISVQYYTPDLSMFSDL